MTPFTVAVWSVISGLVLCTGVGILWYTQDQYCTCNWCGREQKTSHSHCKYCGLELRQ